MPAFLLPIYQAASAQYGIRWEILAAINEIETDYGRNLNISSAGAMGWMQFMPATWRAYGGDASGDGRSDPYNPVDAIFAAARYLSAAGYAEDPRKAIFAYNHANWYVDSVLLRARVIAGVPAGILGSLTGITEGRFPVYARSYYADDVADEGRGKRRRAIEIFARRGAPVVAVTEGVVERIGRSRRLGRYVVLRDLYGNRYTYARLGSVARYHAVPESRPLGGIPPAKALGVRGRRIVAPRKERLFANPRMRGARENGGLDQLFELRARKDPRFEKFVNRLSRPLDIDARDIRLKRLRAGSRVLGGTVLGDTGSAVRGKASHLLFSIRPAGSRRATIDAKPILDGWKLLEATGVHAAGSRSVLVDRAHLSLGRMTMLPKRLLERRVLGDERIEIYPCGRRDIRRGLIDRRVLATMVYLAESGLRPTVTSLRCHHSYLTSSGNVSHHSTGGALDIARVNGIPILGHQDRGGIAEQTVRRLTRLKGTMRPAQIISLLSLGGNTVSMADHADHIHVGFSDGAGRGAPDKTPLSTLTPGQWSNVLSRLRDIENPVVRASR